MRKKRNPILIMAILFGATLVLVSGTIAAATLPSSAVFWSQTHPQVAARAVQPSAAPVVSAVPTPDVASSGPATTPSLATPVPNTPVTPTATTPPVHPRQTPATPKARAKAKAKAKAKKSITYTVKKGDTLSGIAQWFKQHGYKSLYAANKSVIGSDPDLINPGERITISNGVMTLRAPK